MIQNIFIFIIILFATAFQSSFLPHFFSPEHLPDFMLIVMIFVATRTEDFFKVLVWVILGGIVLDMIYFAPVGLNVFAFVAVAFVSNFLARKIFITHGIWTFLSMFGIVIIGTFLNDWILAIFGEIIYRSNFHYPLSLFFGKDIFIKVLFNLITFLLIYWPLKKINDYFNLYYSRTRIFK